MNNTTYILLGVLFVSSGLLSGCQTNPSNTGLSEDANNSEQTETLYDGDAQVLYDAKQKAKTSKEAMEFGEQALQTGAIDRALYQFVTAYQLDSSQYMAMHKVGVIHARRGKLDRALLAFRLALRNKPDHGESLLELGLVELQMRRHEQAREHIELAIESGLESWRAFNGLAVLADLEKDFKVAEQYYDKSLRLNPDSPVLWNNRGYSRYLAGKWSDGEKYIKNALDLDPGYQKAWRNLGLIYVRSGSYDEALDAFDRVMKKQNSYERIGTLAMIEGKYDAAEYFLNRAISESPTYYEAAYDKADRLERLRERGADNGLDQALETTKDSVMYDGLTEMQEKNHGNRRNRPEGDGRKTPVEHTIPE